MSILAKLASAQNKRDETPNKDLGRELVENHDIAGIRQIAENLWHKDKRVQNDCLSVLEQVGVLQSALIEDYAADFIRLIFSKDNRLVWPAMINLALIADRKAQEIFEHYDDLVRVIEKGSVITQDNGIKVLARVAAANAGYKPVIIPYLLEQLASCRAQSVAQYAESMRCAIGQGEQARYLNILNERLAVLSDVQQRRVKKLLRTFGSD